MTMPNDSWDGKFGMKPSVPPQTLRREILKWMHSLDLSQSIRQIRRCVLMTDPTYLSNQIPRNTNLKDFSGL